MARQLLQCLDQADGVKKVQTHPDLHIEGVCHMAHLDWVDVTLSHLWNFKPKPA